MNVYWLCKQKKIHNAFSVWGNAENQDLNLYLCVLHGANKTVKSVWGQRHLDLYGNAFGL